MQGDGGRVGDLIEPAGILEIRRGDKPEIFAYRIGGVGKIALRLPVSIEKDVGKRREQAFVERRAVLLR